MIMVCLVRRRYRVRSCSRWFPRRPGIESLTRWVEVGMPVGCGFVELVSSAVVGCATGEAPGEEAFIAHEVWSSARWAYQLDKSARCVISLLTACWRPPPRGPLFAAAVGNSARHE